MTRMPQVTARDLVRFLKSQELLDLIKVKGREVAEAVARLRELTGSPATERLATQPAARSGSEE